MSVLVTASSSTLHQTTSMPFQARSTASSSLLRTAPGVPSSPWRSRTTRVQLKGRSLQEAGGGGRAGFEGLTVRRGGGGAKGKDEPSGRGGGAPGIPAGGGGAEQAGGGGGGESEADEVGIAGSGGGVGMLSGSGGKRQGGAGGMPDDFDGELEDAGGGGNFRGEDIP